MAAHPSSKKRQLIEEGTPPPTLAGPSRPHSRLREEPEEATFTSVATAARQRGVYVYDNVLSLDDCQELVAVHESERHAGYIHNLTITRCSDLATPHAVHLVLPFLRARHLCWDHAETSFGAELELYPEFSSLMGWHTGSFLKSHHDANREYLQDRHFSAILYLNDPLRHVDDTDDDEENDDDDNKNQTEGFEGGDLVFEFSNNEKNGSVQELRVPPRAGRLVCFPSTSQYVHRVDRVTRGVRYALTLWFTRTFEAMETLESCQALLYACPFSAIKPTLMAPEQPWETPEQASTLLRETMTRAKLVWQASAQQWAIPALVSVDVQRDLGSEKKEVQPPSIKELIHLAAFCVWTHRCPLGELTSNDEIGKLRKEWRCYVAARRGGLVAASKRWRANGIITNATTEEMIYNTAPVAKQT